MRQDAQCCRVRLTDPGGTDMEPIVLAAVTMVILAALKPSIETRPEDPSSEDRSRVMELTHRALAFAGLLGRP